MNTAIYIRHTEGRPGPGIEEQRKACHKYAAEQGYNIVAEYHYSKSDLCKNQSEIKQMMLDIQKKRFQRVLVYSIDIFSFGNRDAFSILIMLIKNKVNVVSVTEPHSLSAEVLLLANIIQAYEEMRSAEHSQKVKEGLRRAKERKAALAAESESA